MNTLWFVLMLVGVGWLMVWSALPPGLRGRYWHPFDMREAPVPAPPDDEAGDAVPATRPAASWRDRAHSASGPLRQGRPGTGAVR